jgi:S1-C subfamily serine protease
VTALRDALHAVADEAAASRTPVADWLTPVRTGIRRRRRRRVMSAALTLTVVISAGAAVSTTLTASRDAPVAGRFPDAVRTAEPSVVQITGIAPSCSRRVQGSGFFFAPHRVMTNAHVLAGVAQNVQVATDGGRTAAAVVVVFDPAHDIAVLRVDGLDEPALRFADRATGGQVAAYTVGYADDGDRTTRESRVVARQTARGPDIYQTQTVMRDIYTLRGVARRGEVGGPVLSLDGRVLGMLFARAVDVPDASYALTAAELASAARDGESASTQVSTLGCD